MCLRFLPRPVGQLKYLAISVCHFTIKLDSSGPAHHWRSDTICSRLFGPFKIIIAVRSISTGQTTVTANVRRAVERMQISFVSGSAGSNNVLADACVSRECFTGHFRNLLLLMFEIRFSFDSCWLYCYAAIGKVEERKLCVANVWSVFDTAEAFIWAYLVIRSLDLSFSLYWHGDYNSSSSIVNDPLCDINCIVTR